LGRQTQRIKQFKPLQASRSAGYCVHLNTTMTWGISENFEVTKLNYIKRIWKTEQLSAVHGNSAHW